MIILVVMIAFLPLFGTRCSHSFGSHSFSWASSDGVSAEENMMIDHQREVREEL